ncbi:hypothetical protein O3M35_001174 [Rhynocoris fuscipes]|uniref:Amyloid protein-binding protein 2 n=1 Tax=Rhynocoris fuscipes TaxID=488301 RepID=A0AAW1DPC5_9HEMI
MQDASSSVLPLYDITVAAVSDYYKYFKKELRILPETILFDVFITLFHQDRLCVLGMEFSDLAVFSRMLKVTNKRLELIKCFQALMKHGTGLAKELASGYEIKCNCTLQDNTDIMEKLSVIDVGIRLGSFLSDAGWFAESGKVLQCCKDLCLTLPDEINSWIKTLDCCHKLLHAEVVYSNFNSATLTKKLAEEIISKIKSSSGECICLAGIYTQFSLYSFYMSDYNEAYSWSIKSIRELGPNVCRRMTVEALSQASKACVVKRKFSKAVALVRQAVYLARESFGTNHPKYADTLLDYGFYLLNSDSMKDSVTVYGQALKLKTEIYGQLNLHVAVSHEDLAYALYVHEYSSGRFTAARQHAEDAINLMILLLPKEHLMLASAQRVKALILEEIALDYMSINSESQLKLLYEAENLHKNALRLALAAFGVDNVQTAKHYGNLGRLYQSMKRYEEAEQMHLKAIEIKEKLLGQDDYEVGLSVGHLASLYNYHMNEYRKAESLYFRSINISLKLFSDTYSGLEYDYRGLVHVYDSLEEFDNKEDYLDIIARWKRLREEQELKDTAPLSLPKAPSSLQEIQEMFSEPPV